MSLELHPRALQADSNISVVNPEIFSSLSLQTLSHESHALDLYHMATFRLSEVLSTTLRDSRRYCTYVMSCCITPAHKTTHEKESVKPGVQVQMWCSQLVIGSSSAE